MVGLLTFWLGVAVAVGNGFGGYGWGLGLTCAGVDSFCAGCLGGLAIGLLGAANLGVGFGSLGMGAGAEILRLLKRLLRLDFFCCCAAAFCLACSCCCVCIAVQTLSFTSFHNASCASASAISNILIH